MNKIFTSIYFNPEFGYIIASYTYYITGGPNIVMKPIQHIQPVADCKCIGNSVLNGLEATRVTNGVTKESQEGFYFWQITGIKGFSAFSKKFRSIDIHKFNNGYEFKEPRRDARGAYVYTKNDKIVKLPLNATVESIGETILQIFSEEVVSTDNSSMSFTTINDNKISYTRPSDDFEDIGDGHTDAYQIYTYENNDNNYIAFLIDNGYDDFTEHAIKLRWEQMYGTLREFDFQVVSDLPVKIRVSGKTKSTMICSEIYQDGDGEMEILYEIDLLNTSVKEKNRIEKEFKKIIASVKIS